MTQRDLGRPRPHPRKYVLPLEVAHDTNLVYRVMTKERKNGSCSIYTNANCNFINDKFALLAAQAIQLYIAELNLLSHLRCDFSVGSIELTIHLEGTSVPKLPNGYLYSTKELHSHEYFNNYDNEVCRVRCLVYTFTYNRTSL